MNQDIARVRIQNQSKFKHYFESSAWCSYLDDEDCHPDSDQDRFVAVDLVFDRIQAALEIQADREGLHTMEDSYGRSSGDKVILRPCFENRY
ncbi:hypothetical protein RRG08_009393 [Elysia crispata]|uniref:Uncharacterized protein n=1 Tax=Elysia crispata TaxID=231223 RepID=A0AAE1DZD8_9GAST|nr:hypothetical protein RRG08_009393 [Elysia crispata]